MSTSEQTGRARTLRLVAASATLAVAAAGAVVSASGTAHADTAGATSSTRAGTSISIRAVHGHVKPGAADAITGDLRVKGEDSSGRPVTLEAKTPGQDGFLPVGDTTTRERGGLRLAVHPEVTTKYRWHYAGAEDARARKSGVTTVHVSDSSHHATRLATNLSIRALHRAVDTHGVDTVKGRLRSHHTGLPHRLVVLLAQPAGHDGWRFAGAHKTGRHGEVDFQVHPASSTRYRLEFPGTTVFRPSHSGVVKVRVRPAPSSISISASPTSVDPGGSTTIAGVATDQGSPVAGATVDLLGRGVGKHASFQQVSTAVTDANGAVSIPATPVKDTIYRLRLERSANAPAGLSRSIEVLVRYPSSLSIRGKHVSEGYSVSGSLRSHGGPLAHRTVTLMGQAPGTTSYVVVDSAKTGRFGVVRFVEASVPGTSYRLAFAGEKRHAAATSGVVVN